MQERSRNSMKILRVSPVIFSAAALKVYKHRTQAA